MSLCRVITCRSSFPYCLGSRCSVSSSLKGVAAASHLSESRWFGTYDSGNNISRSTIEQDYHYHRQQKRWISKRKKNKGKKIESDIKKGEASRIKQFRSAKNNDDNDDDAVLSFEDDENDDDNDEDEDDDETSPLPDTLKLKEKMMKVVTRLTDHFQSIRGAQPTVELFDIVMVNAYGSKTPLSGVAQVVIQSPILATVNCFDPAVSRDVRRAIMDTLELHPEVTEEEGFLKIPLPRVSMEVREQTVKKLRKQTEAAKTRVRNLRKRPMKRIKAGKEGKLEGVSKDEAFRVLKEIDALTEDINKALTSALEEKEKSVLTV